MSLILRVARTGFAAALLVALVGWAFERQRFGSSDRTALARVESELRQRFDAAADTLGTLAARVAANRAVLGETSRDAAAVKRLFEDCTAAIPRQDAGRTGITIYDATAAPLAWAGRVSDLPRARIDGPATLFVAPGALGPRLVRIEPVTDGSGSSAPRLATSVVEQILGTASGAPGPADTFVLSTSIAPVTVRTTVAIRNPESSARHEYSFVIPSKDGGVLVEAEVSRDDLAAARARWTRGVRAAVISVVGVTLLLCAWPTVELRRRAPNARTFLFATTATVAMVLAARIMFWIAAGAAVDSPSAGSPLNLLLTALTTAALAWLAIDLIERRRLAKPRPRVLTQSFGAGAVWYAAFATAGLAGTWLIWLYERIIQAVVSHTDLDVLHFSLHPISAPRIELTFALVLLDAAIIWSAAAMIRVPALVSRAPRSLAWRAGAAAAWVAGVLLATFVLRLPGPPVPAGPLWVAVSAAGASAIVLARVASNLRRSSQAARLFAVFLALLVPAMAMYPSLFAFATDAKELLIAGEYGPQARRQRDDLKLRLAHTLDQIDALPSLPQFVAASGRTTTAAPATDRAFLVWSMTDLATYRLTSAIELYGANGLLVDRFSSLPEYATLRYFPASCNWEAFDEVSPFGSAVLHVTRASRGICERGRPSGAIVVRAMLDYRTLPFISSQSPYLESLRPNREARAEGIFGRDVEFVVYGWSRAPLFTSGTDVWTLPDRVFQRMVESRETFWDELERDGRTYRVHFLNDRGGIYALGYPVITWFGHFINLAELVTLTGVLYLALLLCATLFNLLTSRTPASGRALLREVRSSFYQKLFLAFWLVAVVPVAILAFATRAYFASQLRATSEEAAAKTVTVAQRLVEDYASLQQRGPGSLAGIDDQIMVLVRRAIDEDVNLFDRDRLQATSARDLFATQLLPIRTPGEVYKTILLDRMPTYVGDEQVGDLTSYRLAAAPVRAGGREGIVTVPLTSRQQEIELQIDELDRRVLSAAVLFSLLGAAIGYWMAERIADPVNRLTRATRRIARGDLDARITSTSTDELRRLVDDFNRMAADLQRQRAELERTQRIEAWADMARQVAHDIKNPLTPIQLSAEHALRVNIDRGRPLSPVLDDCVNAILTQVKLLRQIAAEFSSFATSPTPRPEPTSVSALILEVIEPYRAGLAERVAIEVVAPPDLPQANIDRTLFARALTNMIENALHAMPGGGTLTISARVDGPALIVEVADTGVGMDADALRRIFEPYFSTKATGTGLGLTIAKRNVELIGGTIQVRSERGVGTTVVITLPLSAPQR
ncbi:MAG TPA: HAMP domain-containing sensor histidine kinase [Vicinamibacterales bacterium]|nr:HAMP domain-containing sensor histidine kinase [Vicinamibacterales bacterium]